MTENRYAVAGQDDFFLHIEDTTLKEDKHEGNIYNIYQVVNRLNEQDKQIQKLNYDIKELENFLFETISRTEADIGKGACSVTLIVTLEMYHRINKIIHNR